MRAWPEVLPFEPPSAVRLYRYGYLDIAEG